MKKIKLTIITLICFILIQTNCVSALSYVMDGYELYEAFNALEQTQIDFVTIYNQLTDYMIENDIQYDDQEKYIRFLAGDDVNVPLTPDNKLDDSMLYWSIRKNVTEDYFVSKAAGFVNETLDIYRLAFKSACGKTKIVGAMDAKKAVEKALNKSKFQVSNAPKILEVDDVWAVVPNGIINREYISLNNAVDVFWMSEDPNVVSVYRGKLYAKGEGKTTINAYWYGKDKSTSFDVKVVSSSEEDNESSNESMGSSSQYKDEAVSIYNKYEGTASETAKKIYELCDLMISPKELSEVLSDMKLYDTSSGLPGVTVEVCSSKAEYFFNDWYDVNKQISQFNPTSEADKQIISAVKKIMDQYDMAIISEIGKTIVYWSTVEANGDSDVTKEMHEIRLDSVKETKVAYEKCVNAGYLVNTTSSYETSIEDDASQGDSAISDVNKENRVEEDSEDKGFFSKVGDFFGGIIDFVTGIFK